MEKIQTPIDIETRESVTPTESDYRDAAELAEDAATMLKLVDWVFESRCTGTIIPS